MLSHLPAQAPLARRVGRCQRHGVTVRAGYVSSQLQNLGTAGQQKVQGAVEQLTARLSGSGLENAWTNPGISLEDLKGQVEPHWGTQLLKSVVDRWTDALSQYVDMAQQSGGQPADQVQRAMENLSAAFQQTVSQLGEPGEELGSKVQGLLDHLIDSALALQTALADAAASKASILAAAAAAAPHLPQLQLPAALPGSSGPVVLAVVAGVLGLMAALRSPPPPPPSNPGGGSGTRGLSSDQRAAGGYLPTTYDADLVTAYFEAHPVSVAARAAQVAAEAAGLGAGLLLDYTQGKLEENSWTRAAQLRGVIERLGPAYVKVAQALSTRVDLLWPAYLVEIERLQDRVPPFADSAAMDMIAGAYGRPLEEVFSRISPSAVAAASLGQVYQGMLRPEFGGQEVAVKVRRPGVLQSVALDLYLMRQAALALRRFPQIRSDWAGIIDNWADAFFAEMDYQQEADNARRFKLDMEEKALVGIMVPEVYAATHEVLVTQWIDGEKLCESTAADVRELCNTLLTAYLVQLLETGRLHADPHPGNLLRTRDGKIAILDYGLMSTVPADYSLALVEYIAHLSVGDYEAIIEDLVKLGFLPEGGNKAGLSEPLGVLLDQLKQGGGAANINIDLVMGEVEKLADKYPFKIPPYFALILRCFSVIEGIALRVDPNYAIVSECFPYLSRRLLSDNDPRARQALRDLLFAGKQHIDLERVQRIADGFGKYTVSGLTDAPHRRLPAPGSERDALDVAGDRRPLLNDASKEALRVVFSAEGNYVQELMVGEVVATLDAASRQLAAAALGNLLGSAPALAGLSAIEALGPWRSLLLPLPTPLEVLNRVAPVLQPNEDDLQLLATARGVVTLLEQRSPSSPVPGPPSPSEALRLAQEVMPMLPELLPGITKTGELFARQLVKRVALRVANDMEVHRDASGLQVDP